MTNAYNLSQLANHVNTSGQLDLTSGVANNLPITSGGTGAATVSAAKIALQIITALTGSEILPVGTTAQRDVSPASGYIRFNTDTLQFEGYNGSQWTAVGGGATGGGSDQIFVLNGQTITANYTIPSGSNASTAGTVTINSGVTVTVSTGSRWVIV